jgi:hypothetical protein
MVDGESETNPSDKAVVQVRTVTEADSDSIESPQIGLKVGNLPSAMGGITFVTPESTVEQAITLMQIDNFSQLPVLSAIGGSWMVPSPGSRLRSRGISTPTPTCARV